MIEPEVFGERCVHCINILVAQHTFSACRMIGFEVEGFDGFINRHVKLSAPESRTHHQICAIYISVNMMLAFRIVAS